MYSRVFYNYFLLTYEYFIQLMVHFLKNFAK